MSNLDPLECLKTYLNSRSLSHLAGIVLQMPQLNSCQILTVALRVGRHFTENLLEPVAPQWSHPANQSNKTSDAKPAAKA